MTLDEHVALVRSVTARADRHLAAAAAAHAAGRHGEGRARIALAADTYRAARRMRDSYAA